MAEETLQYPDADEADYDLLPLSDWERAAFDTTAAYAAIGYSSQGFLSLQYLTEKQADKLRAEYESIETPTRRNRMLRRTNYEEDNVAFPAGHYSVRQYPGIAFYVRGWETEPDEDTHWSGYEVRTGSVIAVMVGDDYQHRVDADDLTPLDEDAFCHSCGQVGCTHDGRDREQS
jgi:hypothetical protein